MDSTAPKGSTGRPIPSNWREAVCTLIASRSELICLEAKEAARNGSQRLLLLAVAVFLALNAWALVLAGGIAAIAGISGWPWHWIALGTAGLHLLLALTLLARAKSPAAPAFPVTRAEFQKDRSWLENLHQSPKSSD